MIPAVLFDAERHVYTLEDRPLPSVTRILRAAGVTKPLDHIDPEVLEKARRRGVMIHAACERLDMTGEMDDDFEFADQVNQYWQAVMDAGISPIAVEAPIYHPTELYAGTPDLICWIRGTERAVLDRKATYSMDHVATRAQCAAYALAWNALTPNQPITALYGLHLRRDAYSLTQYDFSVARAEWLSALATYREQKEPRKPMLHIVKAEKPIPETHPFLVDDTPPPAEVQVERDVSELMGQANALIVYDSSHAQLAADAINECVKRRKRIEEWFEPLVSAAHGAWKELVARRNNAVAQYEAPEGVIRAKLGAYQAEQEKARKEAAEAAARESRLAAEAERARRAEEARVIGDTERAERIEAAPPPVVPVQAVTIAPEVKVKGAAFVEKWSAEVVDLFELVRAIASGAAPVTLIKADQTALNGMARSLKGALNVPGVRAVCEQSVRATGR